MIEGVFDLPEADADPDFTLVLIAQTEEEGDEVLHVFVTKHHGDDADEVCELALSELAAYLGELEMNVEDLFVASVFEGDCNPISHQKPLKRLIF